jgi:hypothetical protein
MKLPSDSFRHYDIVGLTKASKQLYQLQVKMLNGYSLARLILSLVIECYYDDSGSGRKIFKFS